MTLNGGTIQSSNYISGTQGTKINLSDGTIDSKNFKVKSNGDVEVTGKIDATSMYVKGDLFINNNPAIDAATFYSALSQVASNASGWNSASTYTNGLNTERNQTTGNGFTSNIITADIITARIIQGTTSINGGNANVEAVQFPSTDADGSAVKIENSGITYSGHKYNWSQILNGSSYTLPPATSTSASPSILGGVIVGAGLGVTNTGIISLNRATKTTSTSTGTLGGVIVGDGLNVNNGTVSLAAATADTIGGVAVSLSIRLGCKICFWISYVK